MLIFIRHVIGNFFDWPDIFLFGRDRSKSECVGKTRYEISYIFVFKYGLMPPTTVFSMKIKSSIFSFICTDTTTKVCWF